MPDTVGAISTPRSLKFQSIILVFRLNEKRVCTDRLACHPLSNCVRRHSSQREPCVCTPRDMAIATHRTVWSSKTYSRSARTSRWHLRCRSGQSRLDPHASRYVSIYRRAERPLQAHQRLAGKSAISWREEKQIGSAYPIPLRSTAVTKVAPRSCCQVTADLRGGAIPVPERLPPLYPNLAQVYRQKVERLEQARCVILWYQQRRWKPCDPWSTPLSCIPASGAARFAWDCAASWPHSCTWLTTVLALARRS